MYNARQTLLQLRRSLHTIFHERPSENLKKKLADLQKKKKIYDPKKTKLFVETRESLAYLDTASMPMLLTFIGIAIVAKLGMMYYDAHYQEILEQRIKKLPPGTGTVRMLSREEWEEIREIRPRTPFESKLARPNARIRTDEGLRKEDLKDWAIDVLMDAVTRVEETATHNPK